MNSEKLKLDILYLKRFLLSRYLMIYKIELSHEWTRMQTDKIKEYVLLKETAHSPLKRRDHRGYIIYLEVLLLFFCPVLGLRLRHQFALQICLSQQIQRWHSGRRSFSHLSFCTRYHIHI